VEPLQQPPGGDLKVPQKCRDCEHLRFDSIYEFRCAWQRRLWGGPLRGLDWLGFDLPQKLTAPRTVISFDLIEVIRTEGPTAGSLFLRRQNPSCPMAEAKLVCDEIDAALRASPAELVATTSEDL